MTAAPASAHGCTHSDHYTYYNGHNHYTYFINHHYHGSQHWHTWYDVHGYYESYCFG